MLARPRGRMARNTGAMRRALGIVLRLLAAAVAAVTLVIALTAFVARRRPRPERAPGAPFPFPPTEWPGARSTETSPAPASPPVVAEPWIAPQDGACPTSHPVKAKLSSGIYHVPGGRSYARTTADRCYLDAAAAEADGLRAAKA
jgi:hypothetical protein